VKRRFTLCLAIMGLAVMGLAVTGRLLALGAGNRTQAPPAPDPAAGFATDLSANALYNLGNAYARADQPALAILNYERARLLAPDDPDIEANLRFVRTAAQQPSPTRSRWVRAVTALPPTLTAWLGVAGISCIGIGLITGLRATRYRTLRRSGVVVGVLLIAWNVASGLALWPAVHAAVVVTEATPIRVAPVPMGDPVFTLPLAETVEVTATHEDFVLIRTRTGKTGWAARSNVVPVVPERFMH
jgi:hypothetical protein